MKKAHPAEIERSSLNSFRGYMGKPESGKTALMLKDAQEWVLRSAYVIAVDHNGNMPFKSHDGKPTHVRRLKSIDELKAAIASDPGGILAVQAPAGEVIQVGIEVAAATFRETADGTYYGIPVLIIVDEIAYWQEANKKAIGPLAESVVTNRRHQNILFWYGTQYPGLVHYALILQASDLFLFRMEGKKDLKRLEEGGVSEDVLKRLPLLAPFEFIHVEKHG